MALAALTMAACAPQGDPPQTVVEQIYMTSTAAIERGQIRSDYIPFTDTLAAAIAEGTRLANERDEPFIEGDLASGCQDCSNLTDLTITTTTPPANGRAIVRAVFKVDGQDRDMSYSMVETAEGWRVDNITSPDGFDLRAIASAYAETAARTCAQEMGEAQAANLVRQCLQVSAGTHPPCNAENSCPMIQGEIERSCAALDSAARPDFCPR